MKWLTALIVTIDLALVTFILFRRASRNRFYAAKDAAELKFADAVHAVLSGSVPNAGAASQLVIHGRAEREALKSLLLQATNDANRGRATDLFVRFGYVDAWAQAAFGKRRARYLLNCIRKSVSPAGRAPVRFRQVRAMRVLSLRRAIAVSYLGRLSAGYAAVFLRDALSDPSPYVGRLSIAAIGRNPIPQGVPLLLEELRKAVEGESELPVRSIKTALVRYPIEELHHYAAAVVHPNARFRFLAVDTIREICRKAPAGAVQANFPAELRRWFLAQAPSDVSADVRARSAVVISHLRSPEAAAAVRTLLRDENEFVRLHAVRACKDEYYGSLAGEVVQRITDRRWRVREAAVRTLAVFPDGRQKLGAFFLNTADRYASEQIADELQRSGTVLKIVDALAAPEAEGRQALAVCSKLVALDMDSLLIEHVATARQSAVRGRVLEALRPSQSPRFAAVLQPIAADEADPLRPQARAILEGRQAQAAAAAAEQN